MEIDLYEHMVSDWSRWVKSGLYVDSPTDAAQSIEVQAEAIGWDRHVEWQWFVLSMCESSSW